MANGLLRVTGTIDVGQFWPGGESDADTVKVVVGANAFAFQKTPNGAFKVTHAFEGATVSGKVRKAPIDSKGRVTIRLQAIDAPELHYDPLPAVKLSTAENDAFKAAKGKGEFRQPLGETASMALAKLFGKSVAKPVPCKVLTYVSTPNDVFDTYGRLVGEIVVKIGGKNVNLNEWLAASGWAFPTFYNSMSDVEITRYRNLAAKAMSKDLGVWKHLSKAASKFDFKLRYRLHGTPDAAADKGPVLMPKLFRRQSVWAVGRRAKVYEGSIGAFLAAHPDACFETDDFLEQGPFAAKLRRLDEFVSAAGKFTTTPQRLVFREAPSKVVGPTGKPVAW